jgi:hypothetical protein
MQPVEQVEVGVPFNVLKCSGIIWKHLDRTLYILPLGRSLSTDLERGADDTDKTKSYGLTTHARVMQSSGIVQSPYWNQKWSVIVAVSDATA